MPVPRYLPLLAIGLLAGGSVAAQDPADAAQRFAAVNQQARAHYARATQDALAKAGPVIVVEPDHVTLRQRGGEQREAHTSPRYHRLKEIGHVALGLYALLIPQADASDLKWRDDVLQYRAAVAGLVPLVDALGLRWDDTDRQRGILTKSVAFMDRVLAQGRVTATELRSYADDVGPALLGNAYDAAELQLEALHAIVTRWRAAMTDDERARLLVVVLGPGRPREGHPPLEYFARLLGPEAAATRLVAAENLREVAGGLDLLATGMVDRGAADYFFNDSGRLDRGLLTAATHRHLDRLFSGARQ